MYAIKDLHQLQEDKDSKGKTNTKCQAKEIIDGTMSGFGVKTENTDCQQAEKESAVSMNDCIVDRKSEIQG